MTDHATGQTTTFTYDGNGALVKKVVGGVTTVYPSTAPSFLSGLRLRAGSGSHYEKQGSVVFKYFYFNGQRVAMKKDGVVYFLAGDHLGSTALTVSSGGVKVAELRYKAWGETRYTWGTTPTSFRYTGQRQEESLGLYRMGARWVDPALSRWLSADTLVPNPSNSQSFNRYSWVRNNPLKYIDSTGHREEGECGFSGEACPGDEPPPPPQPTPSQPIPDPPFWDIDRGAVRHLVESCGPLECSAAVFNAYTPGGWDFHIADEWHTATSEVYNTCVV